MTTTWIRPSWVREELGCEEVDADRRSLERLIARDNDLRRGRLESDQAGALARHRAGSDPSCSGAEPMVNPPGGEGVGDWGSDHPTQAQGVGNKCCRCKKAKVRKQDRGKAQGYCALCFRTHVGTGRNPIKFLESAPAIDEEVDFWLATADWPIVESAWVSLLVERHEDGMTTGQVARCLATVRLRYRAMIDKRMESGAPRKRNAHAP